MGKWGLLLLTLTLILGGCTTMSNTKPFVDVSPDRNTFEAIDGLREEGWMVGRQINPPMFYPDSNVTRAEISVLIVRAFHGPSVKPPSAVGTVPDVPTSYWGASWIEAAINADLMDLFPDGNFYPRNPATRADIASLVWLLK